MSNEEKKNGLQENDSPKQVEAGTEESQSKKIETEKKEGVKDTMAKGLPKRKKTTGGKGSPQRGLPKKNKAKLRPWQIVLIVLGILCIAGCATVFALYQANRVDISSDTYTTKEKTQIISSDNVVIAEIFSKNQSYVSLDQVPQDLRNALVATEDSRFYTHNGVDFFGIVRSLVGNLVSRSATGQGASTITQQLARLLYLPDIGSEQTFSDSVNRKFKEISIAWQLEEKYSKDQIMEMYLNEYYFGSSAYGVEEAAETYFGKTVAECNLAECAMLAGLPQAPSAYAPNSDFEAAKARQKVVLDRMVSEKYITQQQADEAYATEITIVPWSADELNNQITPGYEAFVNKALQEYALSQAPKIMKEQGLSEDAAVEYIRTNIASGGYKIYTTIDTRYQNSAINAVTSGLPKAGYGDEFTGALVTVDLDGSVRAYYGGNTDVDMANSARQPGSGIKPLYYSGAFEQGVITPDTTVMDERTTFGGWSPQNYGNSYSGAMTYRQALIQSKNIPAVKAFDAMGVDNAIQWIKGFGISTIVDDDYNLSTALGGMTNGIKPLEMAAAFNVVNNNGVYNEPYFVVQIQKTNGDQVFDKSQFKLDTHQVMSSNTASTMWSILQQVVTSGTGTSAANALPTAGKTGTTDNEVDLWFNGMTANISSSVWCGAPDNTPIGSGSYIPAGIYGTYVRTLINEDVLVAQ